MNKIWFVILLILFSFSNAQNKQVEFLDFEIIKSKIFVLKKDSSIAVLDLKTLRQTNFHLKEKVRCIGKTKRSFLFSTSDNVVHELNYKNGTIRKRYDAPYKLYKLLTDSKNHLFGVGYQKIYDFQQLKTHVSTDEPIMRTEPEVFFMDSKNRIWSATDLGEWGGDMLMLDTEHKVMKNLNFSNVNSITEDKLGNLYFGHSIMHFDVYSIIIKLSPAFHEENIFSNGDRNEKLIYMGPIIYNKLDDFLYMYSNEGFYKVKNDAKKEKLKDWKFVVKTRFSWEKTGRKFAVGTPINVSKLEVLPNGNILFLTKLNGFGILSGNKVQMLNFQ